MRSLIFTGTVLQSFTHNVDENGITIFLQSYVISKSGAISYLGVQGCGFGGICDLKHPIQRKILIQSLIDVT